MSLRSILTITAICLAGTLQAQDQKPKALALVKEAVAFAKKNGKEALVKEVNQGSGRFHVKSGEDAYIFIYDMQGLCMAMGYQTQAVGTNRWTIKDPDGVFIVQEFIKVAKGKGSGWVDYKFPNPKSGKVEPKTTYVEALDGWVIGCGVYK
jgi:signal transduction histidine kinase